MNPNREAHTAIDHQNALKTSEEHHIALIRVHLSDLKLDTAWSHAHCDNRYISTNEALVPIRQLGCPALELNALLNSHSFKSRLSVAYNFMALIISGNGFPWMIMLQLLCPCSCQGSKKAQAS